jgi:predicted HAD superfamily hydrolase
LTIHALLDEAIKIYGVIVLIDLSIYEQYLKRLKPTIKVVSFDIFNTLLMRLTPVQYVFQISSQYLSQNLQIYNSISLSPKLIFNHKNKFKLKFDRLYFLRESEWTITMWLQSLAKEFAIDPQILIPLGKKSELAAEFECTEIADDSLRCVEIAKESGYKVIATSDMWLESPDMEILLKRYGLYFNRVFTSGSLGVSKRRGTIFKRIQAEMGYPASYFAHIGDNPKADWFRPRLAGWKPLKVTNSAKINRSTFPTIHGIFETKQRNSNKILQILDRPLTTREHSPYYRTAYDDLAPLLILFTIWSRRRFRRHKINTVFFSARDARAMFDVYQMIATVLPNTPKAFYVRLSRKIVAVAHPDNLLMDVKHLPGKVGKKRIGQWLNNFTLEAELKKRILEDSGLSESVPFTSMTRKTLQLSILRHRKEITNHIKLQKKLVYRYLLQQSKFNSLKRIGLVDSGWACTQQDCLRQILKDTEVIYGTYFGVSAQGKAPVHNSQKYGFLRDDFRNLLHMNPIESSAGVVRLWDTILREPAGTATDLATNGKGEVYPIIDNISAIGELERESASLIHEGIIAGVKSRIKSIKLLSTMIDHFSDTDIESAAAVIAMRITTRPDKEKASAFIRLGFDEGTDNRRKASIGISGIRKGVAWYPGILSVYRLPLLFQFLEIAAKIMLIVTLGFPKKGQ